MPGFLPRKAGYDVNYHMLGGYEKDRNVFPFFFLWIESLILPANVGFD